MSQIEEILIIQKRVNDSKWNNFSDHEVSFKKSFQYCVYLVLFSELFQCFFLACQIQQSCYYIFHNDLVFTNFVISQQIDQNIYDIIGE